VGNIYSIALAGGEPTLLTSASREIVGFDWVGKDRGIIFSDAGSLWRVQIPGGQPEQLTWAGQDVFYPAVSRNGNSLAFQRHVADTNIWELKNTGSQSSPGKATRLVSSTRIDGNPQFSPDASKIAFQSNRSGSPEIWICEADGSAPLQLTSLAARDTGTPRWSPDGQAIVFPSTSEGSLDIYIVTLRGGQPRRLTTERSDEVRPSWSRDGQWVYFGSNRTGAWQVWRVPASGGQAVQVTKQGGREAFESIDGRSVYYSKGFDVTGLWETPTEGGNETFILDGLIQGWWAIANGGIYFVARESTPTIRFHNLATKSTSEVATVGRKIGWRSPDFSVSPDGQRILYVQIDRTEIDLMLVENFR
jgi:eukaryotic-like serine/threonine-protein kinase